MSINKLNQDILEKAMEELGRLYFSREAIISESIRERYSVNDELAILRQRDTKPEEYAEYNAFVEDCKTRAKESWQRQEEVIARLMAEKTRDE